MGHLSSPDLLGLLSCNGGSAPELSSDESAFDDVSFGEAAAAAAAERMKVFLRNEARRMRRRRRRTQRRADSRRILEDQIRDMEPKHPWSRDPVLQPPVVKGESSRIPPVKEEDDEGEEGEECPGLEPFFFDEVEALAEHEVRLRRQREEEQEERRRQEEEERLLRTKEAALRKIHEYDPKQGRVCSTRIDFVDLRTFDLDEESPLGPMRETDAEIDMLSDVIFKYRKKQEACSNLGEPASAILVKSDSSHGGYRILDFFVPCFQENPLKIFPVKIDSPDVDFRMQAAGENLYFPSDSTNLLSVKIVSCDIGFPINVYGTVIARDILDRKCVYIFHCDRDHSHLILTKNEELMLTGPKRGLALIDAIYFEVDLKIKSDGKQKKDKQLSKGYIQMNGTSYWIKDDMEPKSYTLNSMLSQVVVMCAVVKCAVEATIAIEIVHGKFCGEITVCTTSTRNSIVIHDSKLMSAEMTGKGVIPLLRSVVAVGLRENLIMTITRAGVCKAERERTIKFTPSVSGGGRVEVTCGSVKMFVKVSWSIISRHHLDF